jgi:chromosome segregation ATPase
MAREATITQEQVNAAADALRAAGAKPTVRAVRERLGNTGSNATVMRLLSVWQGGQVKPAETPITLPAALQRALVDYVGQAVAEGKAELAADLAELQQVNADLVSESERQAAAIEALEGERDVVQSERDAFAGRVQQLEADLVVARGEAEQERLAAEAARTEHAKAMLRLEAMPRLEADLAAMRAELDKERAGRVVAEQAAAVAEARREAERAARAHIEGELATARQLIERAEAKIERGEAYGRDMSDRMHALQAATYEANAKAQSTEEQLRRAQDELAAVRADLIARTPGGEAAAASEKPAGGKTRR